MRTITKLAAGTALALATVSVANAGGYQRGQADIDFLFEQSSFATRAGLTYVNPRRGFESVTITPGTFAPGQPGAVPPGTGVSGGFGDYTGNYAIPNMSALFGAGELGACAGNYTESFAAEADYRGLPGGATPAPAGRPNEARQRTQEFDSDEFSVNCRLSMALGTGRASLIGGVYIENFNFETSTFSNQNITPLIAAQIAGTPLAPLLGPGSPFAGSQIILPVAASTQMDGGYQTGFRVGAAYEIPEIALRGQIVYRSEVDHDEVSGTSFVTAAGAPFVVLPGGQGITGAQFLSALPPAAGAIAAGIPAPGSPVGVLPATLNTATSPQSINLSLQTGIAEGTLLVGSLRWTDWSTNEQVVVNAGPATSTTPFRWRDGYTASLGLGRAFSETISGLVAIGYDRGVSTGAETTYTDLYTVSGGLSLTEGFGNLRVGGLVGYWTDGSQSIDRGANFDASVGDDWVFGGNASFTLSF